MAEPSKELVDFVIVLIYSVIACYRILSDVSMAICDNTKTQGAGYIQTLQLKGNNLIHNISAWPVIVQVNSGIHETIKELHEHASWWLGECLWYSMYTSFANLSQVRQAAKLSRVAV
jgi:hypothetical protein